MEAIPNVDSTALHALLEWILEWKRINLTIYLTDIKGPLRDYFMKTNFAQKVGEEAIKLSIEDALNSIDGLQERNGLKSYIFQTNDPK